MSMNGWSVDFPDPSGEVMTTDMLLDALRSELIYLWGDLASAYRYSQADPPENSMGCLNLIRRIHAITRIIGPVSKDQVEIWFLATGMYEKVHAQMGLLGFPLTP